MCGLGLVAGFAFTPKLSGILLVHLSGIAENTTLAGDGTTIQLQQGTGTAPSAGATVSGTARGQSQRFVASTTAGRQGFAINTRVTGLAINTAVWFDLSVIAVTGGGASIQDINITILEVPS
jgi:hypothetical protein